MTSKVTDFWVRCQEDPQTTMSDLMDEHTHTDLLVVKHVTSVVQTNYLTRFKHVIIVCYI